MTMEEVYQLHTPCRSLSTAIGDAEAVICAVGASSAFNPSAFDEVDRKVWHSPRHAISVTLRCIHRTWSHREAINDFCRMERLDTVRLQSFFSPALEQESQKGKALQIAFSTLG